MASLEEIYGTQSRYKLPSSPMDTQYPGTILAQGINQLPYLYLALQQQKSEQARQDKLLGLKEAEQVRQDSLLGLKKQAFQLDVRKADDAKRHAQKKFDMDFYKETLGVVKSIWDEDDELAGRILNTAMAKIKDPGVLEQASAVIPFFAEGSGKSAQLKAIKTRVFTTMDDPDFDWEGAEQELMGLDTAAARKFMAGPFTTQRKFHLYNKPYYDWQEDAREIKKTEDALEMLEKTSGIFPKFMSQAKVDAGVPGRKGQISKYGALDTRGKSVKELEEMLSIRAALLQEDEQNRLKKEKARLLGIDYGTIEDDTTAVEDDTIDVDTPPVPRVDVVTSPQYISQEELSKLNLSREDKNIVNKLQMDVKRLLKATKRKWGAPSWKKEQEEKYKEKSKELSILRIKYGLDAMPEKPDNVPQDNWDNSTIEQKIEYFKSINRL